MIHDDRMAWWSMTTNGLAGGILPNWEAVLILATRPKFHLGTTHLMEMMIALNSSFRVDQNWYKDHLIWTSGSVILNLCPLMCKLFRLASPSCRLKKPNGHVSSLTTNCINTSDLIPHLASSSFTHSSLFSSNWSVQLLGSFSLSHMWLGGRVF